MPRHMIGSLFQWLKRVVTQPRQELGRWQRKARFIVDLFRYGARQLSQDRAPQMAAALAFRTLFALVPVLIVGTIVVKGLRGTDVLLDLTSQLFVSLGLDEIHVIPPAEVAAEIGEQSLSLAEWLQGLVKDVTSVNLAAIGWVGAALIGYAAISLVVTIENAFNTVYRAPAGRPWTRRIPLYWFVLTISPVAVGATWYINSQVASWIASMPAWEGVLVAATTLWRLLAGWLILFAIYTQLPNTAVRLWSAAAGALVAVLLLELGKQTLDAYLQNVLAISQLYGSLGLVPLFMFWVYLMWLAVLFGLQVSATLQALRGRPWEEMEPHSAATGLFEPATVVTAAEIVAERFAAGQSTTARDVAEICGLPETVVAQMFDRLVGRHILHWVDGGDSAVTLSRPADQIPADELMQVGFELADEGGLRHQSEFAERLRAAQCELASPTTLATLVATKPPP